MARVRAMVIVLVAMLCGPVLAQSLPAPIASAADILISDDIVHLERRAPERRQLRISALELTGLNLAPPDSTTPMALEQQSGMEIGQYFSRRAVRVDETVDVQLSFRNLDVFWRYYQIVDVYFVREDALIVATPANCWETLSLSLQPILRCALGNFQPGEAKTVSYTVLAGEASRPYILNTAIVDEFRSDAFIAVVDDVRTDSDEDGISDFNEALLETDPFDPQSVDHSNVTIDIAAFYTPDAAALYPRGIEARINQFISVANQVYADSDVGITLRPVYYGSVDYDGGVSLDTALTDIVFADDPALADVESLRATYGGDLAILFKPRGEETRCGLANLGGFSTEGSFDPLVEREFAWSAIAIDCPLDLVVVHELGHNMGLTHSHVEDGGGGTFDFSTGYGVDSAFVTVMAYPGAFSAEVKVARFSDPDTDCLGHACGRPAEGPQGADAVQSLNLVKYQIADYFPQRVADLPQKQTVTLSGAETTASISMGATTDEGLSYTEDIYLHDLVDIALEVQVDDEHVGEEGRFHVVITSGADGFFELNENYEFIPWDGNVDALQGFGDTFELRTRYNIKLVNDIYVDAGLIGAEMWIFFAYRVVDSGELVFSGEPLFFRFVDLEQ